MNLDVDLDFKKITAGGLVVNQYNEVLLIFRKNLWDLPKGKIEFYETLEKAALREVVEETGVLENCLELVKPLVYKTYQKEKKGKKIEKKTMWFLMKYNSNNLKLCPQTEESIEQALWVSVDELSKYLEKSRNYVLDVVQEHFNHQNKIQ
tara:strand:+ start:356 stop:805 length:450 start_codon:yes stop_codon:yes gene_type:complete